MMPLMFEASRMLQREPWIDVWEPAGEWTRALARYLGSRECLRHRVERDEYASLDADAFQQLARTVEGFAMSSLVIVDLEHVENSLRLVHHLRRHADVPCVMVVLRPAHDHRSWAFRAAGATMIFDEFWQAAMIAGLARRFSARQVVSVLSLEDQIWKNLPWNHVLCHDIE